MIDLIVAPFLMDWSNQAGWWQPQAFGPDGRIVYALNIEAEVDGQHRVLVATQDPAGSWGATCLPTPDATACMPFIDDAGHRQPTVAVDGAGHVHVWAGMHRQQWHYWRTTMPGDLSSLAWAAGDLDAALPGQTWTYPVATTDPDGSVWVTARNSGPTGATPNSGELFRWDGASWSHVVTYASEPSFAVYPDDLAVDSSGRVHVVWQWSYLLSNTVRHLGSHAVWDPAAGLLDATGAPVAAPATTETAQVIYHPVFGTETKYGRGAVAGIQTAKLTLRDGVTPVIAVRARSAGAYPWRVKLAEHTPSGWRREMVYAGAYDTAAALDVTTDGQRTRVYYLKTPVPSGLQAHVGQAEDGAWAWNETALEANAAERLAVLTLGGSDRIYVAYPARRQLVVGALPW